MPISYKHKIYTTLGTPTGLSGDVVSVTDSAGVPAKDYTVKGKSIVWNQLFTNSVTSSNGVTILNNQDGTMTLNGTANQVFINFNNLSDAMNQVHKYLLCLKILNNPDNVSFRYGWLNRSGMSTSDISTGESCAICNQTSSMIESEKSTGVTNFAAGTVFNNVKIAVMVMDLTKMFGAGNEPTTVAEFRAMFPDDYYPYNVGELKSIIPTSVEASTVNLLNLVGRKEISSDTVGYRPPTYAYPEIDTHVYYRGVSSNGYLMPDTVTEATVLSSSVIVKTGTSPASHGYGVGIPLTVIPSTTYYIKCTTPGVIGIGYVNSNKIITTYIWTLSNNQFTTPGDCRYVLIVFRPDAIDALATFENICVSAVQTNEYQPYNKYRVNIPSSKYFPDGMKSAGSVYDEINFLSQKAIKRIGVVDLGTIDWEQGGYGDKTSWVPVSWRNNIKPVVDTQTKANIICSVYNTETIYDVERQLRDKSIAVSQKSWIYIYDSLYKTATASEFKAAMSGVMLYYELATPVETTITPSLQALSTFNGFTSFSAPNSLTQNGPLSVTYYAEGGANPEKGWLTSYKRKLYMGRNIEWNQLFTNSVTSSNGVTISNNQDGTITLNGTANLSYIAFTNLSDAMNQVHKYLLCLKILNNPDNVSFRYSWLNRNSMYTDKILTGESCVVCSQTESSTQLGKGAGLSGFTAGTVFNNVKIAVMVMDLTQMFGAGNEPATPEEFWSYFDHKLYPYNSGETQPLFKISRKSLWTVAPKHYTARWDKVHAAMVRLNDAASFPTDITNFAHRGSVNANYSNPFDNIYPWSEIKLCNISIDLYRNLAAGDSITKCVTAWEGDANFSYNDVNGVWRYRPEFWGKSWEDDTYRYFDVADNKVYNSSYVYYPEAIVGRWHGRTVTITVGGKNQICLVPSVGMPAKRIAVRNLQIYAKHYGATIDSIFSIDADVLLCIVEFATMNTQNAIGNGVTSMYRQSSDLIAEDATNSNVVKVLASAASSFCIPGAIFDIGTSNGGAEVGSYYIVSAQPNIVDAQYLDVTLNEAVTVTTANYWSVHGIINVADEEIGSKSGYIGTNGKCNSYYRGLVLFGNMWLYTLGAYENKDDHHIWIANSDEEADKYVALNTSVHYDTGLVLPTAGGYTKKLGMLSRSGLLSIPVFCTETGGDNRNPTGDYFFNGAYTYNTVLLRGGAAYDGSIAGAFYGHWSSTASYSGWDSAARPRLKNP